VTIRSWFERRPLIALQVEVTSRCTRRCAVCPRTALSDEWRDGDLSDATWDRLRVDLGLARHVHLQGWGEPLLHPRLPEMVDHAKRAGCSVGLTTNGDRLPEATDWIVGSGLDGIVVSVAGDEATHAELRDGSRVAEVWAAVRGLSYRRASRRRPRIQASFLATRSNVQQCPDVVRAAAEAGADEVFAVHLDCTPTAELADLALCAAGPLRPAEAAAFDRAARVAREVGIEFRAPARSPDEMLVCAAAPLRTIYVGWDGRVGPCVGLVLPISGAIPRFLGGTSVRVVPRDFGNLAELGLREILGGAPRREFLAMFEKRLADERRFLDSVAESYDATALARLDEADRRRSAELAVHGFPDPCRGCPRAIGW
jgi:MoaA/NifB/PqqE/SkfB family radical SAM enzyme